MPRELEVIDWRPMQQFREPQPILPIKEPPCRTCQHFRPVQLYDHSGSPAGVRVCHGEKMHSDFSCYAPIKRD